MNVIAVAIVFLLAVRAIVWLYVFLALAAVVADVMAAW